MRIDETNEITSASTAAFVAAGFLVIVPLFAIVQLGSVPFRVFSLLPVAAMLLPAMVLVLLGLSLRASDSATRLRSGLRRLRVYAIVQLTIVLYGIATLALSLVYP